jgi:hypothetical protein
LKPLQILNILAAVFNEYCTYIVIGVVSLDLLYLMYFEIIVAKKRYDSEDKICYSTKCSFVLYILSHIGLLIA